LAVARVGGGAVAGMVGACGRVQGPVQEREGVIRFVVLVGIPETMDSDYLRLVGTLMRVFRNDKLRDKLRYAENPAEVIDIFERVETGIESVR